MDQIIKFTKAHFFKFFSMVIFIALLMMLATPSAVYANDRTHTVAPGQTVYAISRLYGVPVSDIIAANNLVNPNLIKVGQVLVIPGTDGGSTNTESPTPTPQPQTNEQRTHTVQRGQTLGQIARLYGVTANQIASANQLLNVNLIYVGQILAIPGGSAPSTPAQPTPTPETPAPAPVPSTETTHTVAPGDTIGRIAA
ncbi:MAG: LysM peptidoglycan-binding domain-containing protein, partial [Chloroflexota bacterium]